MTQHSIYNHQFVEEKIYNYWIKKGYFYSIPNKKTSYSIVIPPPNVTGILHIGHILNNTLQDVLVRRARMQGYNVCWIPGTDHASIATEAKVIGQLSKENKTKYHLSRDYFLVRSWEWMYKQEFIILNQLQKLGCSCDWKRTSFTMDKERSRSVTHCFIELYNRGLIYRDFRLVNWDTQAKTTISNEEVHYQEQKGHLYYILYPIIGIKKKYIVVTTSRPETIFGDTGICIHPKDNRYTLLIGKQAIIPIVDKIVPIIKDEYVDKRFGSGALKITPSHDVNDTILAKIYSLDFIDLLNEDGTLNKNGGLYIGKKSSKVRNEIVEVLYKKGLLVKIETYTHRIAFSERTNSIIEIRRSIQWYLKTKGLAKPALTAVKRGYIRFNPKSFNNIYIYWMKNIQDWNISRQLWWGHRIPVYYYGINYEEYVVAETKKKALELIKNKTLSIENLIQDEDVLDTWFSSWIWPISVFDGLCLPKNYNIQYYYPTKDLITGPDILFFWIARMIMAGYAFLKKKPFYNVYFTGIVRDLQGRKMSKSIGNYPDTIELIKKYGSDGVRMGLMLSTQAGNDLFFKEELCIKGKNFSNKLWNAYYLIHKLKIDISIETPQYSYLAIEWFEYILSKKINSIENSFKKFNISKALKIIYNLIWNDFCSWYLEIIKPTFNIEVSQFVWDKTLSFFEDLIKLLHPYIPYITENIWIFLKKNSDNKSLIISKWPIIIFFSKKQIFDYFNHAKKIIISIRNIRKINSLSLKNPILIFSKKKKQKKFYLVVLKLTNSSQINFVSEKPLTTKVSLLIDSQEYFIFVFNENKINNEKIKNIKINIEYYSIFLLNIKNKIDNNFYIVNAPHKIINIERKKYTDILEKIKLLKNNLDRELNLNENYVK